jgi:membrane-associated phospholipid phosphatase
MNAVDTLNTLIIFLVSIIAAFMRPELGEEAFWLLGLFASLALFMMVSVFLATRRPVWRVVHDFSSVVLLIVIFNAIGPLIEGTSAVRWDTTFAALDERWFGILPELWRTVGDRPAWLTDLNYLAYFAYYLVPLVLGIILYLHDPAQFRTLVFTVVLTFYLSYIGYFIFPTIGPRPPLAAEPILIGGGTISHAIRAFINFAERNRTNAFPSAHTAVTLVCLYFASHMSRRVFAIYIAATTGIIFSTVYLQYHYVIDVVAGTALAWGCIWLGPHLELLVEPRGVRKWLTVPREMR